MSKNSIFIITVLMTSSLVRADVLDFLRRPEDRQDQNAPVEDIGGGFKQYRTRSGDTETHWAPVEGLFGPHREREEREEEYEDEEEENGDMED